MQLERLDFAAAVSRMAGEAGVDPKWVRFEITESAMIKSRKGSWAPYARCVKAARKS